MSVQSHSSVGAIFKNICKSVGEYLSSHAIISSSVFISKIIFRLNVAQEHFRSPIDLKTWPRASEVEVVSRSASYLGGSSFCRAQHHSFTLIFMVNTWNWKAQVKYFLKYMETAHSVYACEIIKPLYH